MCQASGHSSLALALPCDFPCSNDGYFKGIAHCPRNVLLKGRLGVFRTRKCLERGEGRHSMLIIALRSGFCSKQAHVHTNWPKPTKIMARKSGGDNFCSSNQFPCLLSGAWQAKDKQDTSERDGEPPCEEKEQGRPGSVRQRRSRPSVASPRTSVSTTFRGEETLRGLRGLGQRGIGGVDEQELVGAGRLCQGLRRPGEEGGVDAGQGGEEELCQDAGTRCEPQLVHKPHREPPNSEAGRVTKQQPSTSKPGCDALLEAVLVNNRLRLL